MITELKNVELKENQFYLPVGIEVSGERFRKVTLKVMDGTVEESMGDQKVANNAGKIITELLYGIIEEIEGLPKVTKDVVRNMTITDRDFLLPKNFEVSFGGNEIKFNRNCETPNCNTTNELTAKIDNLETTYFEDTEDRLISGVLPNGIKTSQGLFKNIKLRLPTGADQEVIAPTVKQNPGQANTALLHRVTVSITDENGNPLEPINPNTFKAMSKRDRDYVNKILKEGTPGVDFTIKYHCSGCGKEQTTKIPMNSFLAE